MIYLLILSGVFAVVLVVSHILHNKRFSQEKSTNESLLKYIEKKDAEWKEERQQLLDRIQSPTFAEYKHQEVKVIKAKNGTDKPDIVIEQL